MKFSHRSACIAVSLAAACFTARAQQPPLQGEWTFNEGASTKPPAPADGRGSRGDSPRGGGGGRGGGLGRGGRGGAFGPRGGNTADPNGNMPGSGGGAGGPAAQRLQEEMRQLNTPPARLTIVQTDTIVVITTEEGRTTRLAPNDKKIKDENSGIARQTKWDAGKLVNEITGLPNGTVTQTYSVDPELHRLHVVTVLPNRQNPKEPITLDRVYDAAN